jgi:hypothetical protein
MRMGPEHTSLIVPMSEDFTEQDGMSVTRVPDHGDENIGTVSPGFSDLTL